jgi:hypothetical protein
MSQAVRAPIAEMPRSKEKAKVQPELPLPAPVSSLARTGKIELLTLSVSAVTYAAIRASAKKNGRSMAEEARAWLEERARAEG